MSVTPRSVYDFKNQKTDERKHVTIPCHSQALYKAGFSGLGKVIGRSSRHVAWMESSCHDHQAGMGCMKHDIWCEDVGGEYEGCMRMYSLHVVEKARKVSGSRWQAICKPPGWMESFDIQAFIQEELLGGSQPSRRRLRLSACL